MTASSSCAATTTVTEGIQSALRTRRIARRASARAASGYPTCVHASAPSEPQKTALPRARSATGARAYLREQRPVRRDALLPSRMRERPLPRAPAEPLEIGCAQLRDRPGEPLGVARRDDGAAPRLTHGHGRLALVLGVDDDGPACRKHAVQSARHHQPGEPAYKPDRVDIGRAERVR